MRGVWLVGAMCAALVVSCSDGEVVRAEQDNLFPVPVSCDQALVVPTSVIRIDLRATERILAKKATVRVEGKLSSGEQVSYEFEAKEDGADGALRRVGGDVGNLFVQMPVDQGLWAAINPADGATLEATITVTLLDYFDQAVARGVLEGARWSFESKPEPVLTELDSSGEVYLGQQIPLLGTGFLRPEEGTTWAVIERGSMNTASGRRDLTGQRIAVIWGGQRQRAYLPISPGVLGVAQGSFEGDVRLINELRDGTSIRGLRLETVQLALQRSFISTLSPGRGSRGQKIKVQGRGLIAADAAQGYGMTLAFAGVFTPTGGEPIDLTGVNALERQADRVESDEQVELAVWYSIDGISGGKRTLSGLGAAPGVFAGRITPKLYDAFGGVEEGLAWEGRFEVLPMRQVIYLKYLPRFSQGLERYGVRNVEVEIRKKILEAAQAPYAAFNVDFRDTPPEDFVDYATIELSGPDPYGRQAFGYDNSFNGVAKDVDNLFLADYIGGYNQGSKDQFDNPFGGIYIESFDYFSPKLSAKRNGSANADASPEFDRILGPFMPELGGDPVLASEWPNGPRSAQIQEAIHMIGNVIGNTVAHESGHSMGLAFFPGDREEPGMRFHSEIPFENCLMDAGSDRPFEERANINGKGPAIFCDLDAMYLMEILPRQQ
jgi:hypothetical protein